MAAEVLQSTGNLRLRVTGSSMLPTLWPGDLLHFESIPAHLVKPGSIVLVDRRERFVVHRVIRQIDGKGCGQIVTRGDSMAEEDPPVPASNVMGRVTRVERGPRVMADFARSPAQKILGWLLCHSELLHRVALKWHATWKSECIAEAPCVAR
jgi:signal peptidase I